MLTSNNLSNITYAGVSIDDLPLPTPRNWFEGWSWDEPGNSVRTAMHGLSSQLKKIHLQAFSWPGIADASYLRRACEVNLSSLYLRRGNDGFVVG